MLLAEKRALRLSTGSRVRITSVCLERPFWQTLEHMAQDAECSLAHLISQIDTHVRASETGERLASCLRVVCLKWLEMQRQKNLNTDPVGRQTHRSVIDQLLDKPAPDVERRWPHAS